MPPHSTPEEVIIPASTSTSTRELLVSLEELRDSLSTRVNQLSVAVERLRGQTVDLERVLEMPRDNERNLSLNGEPSDPSIMPPTNQPFTSTSAIASELHNLSRPISSAEIHRLLDRASASLTHTPNVIAPGEEDTLEGLRSIRGELQASMTNLTAVGEAHTNLRHQLRTMRRSFEPSSNRVTLRNTRYGSPEDETTQHEVQRRLTAIRENGKETRAAKAASAASSRKKFNGEGKRGLPPTNIKGKQPEPQIVRSLPPTPASPIIAEPPSSPKSPSPVTTGRIIPPTPPQPRSRTIQSPIPNITELQNQIADLDINLEPSDYVSRLTRIINQASPNVSTSITIMDESGNILHENTSSSSHWGPPPPVRRHRPSRRSNRNGNEEDTGMTFRGRDVQERIEAGLREHQERRERRDRGETPTERDNEIIGRVRRSYESVDPNAASANNSNIRNGRRLAVYEYGNRDDVSSINPRTQLNQSYESMAEAELQLAQTQIQAATRRYNALLTSRQRVTGGGSSLLSSEPVNGGENGNYHRLPHRTEADYIRDESDARRELMAAQMRESRAQQRLSWARSRLRRENHSNTASDVMALALASGSGSSSGSGVAPGPGPTNGNGDAPFTSGLDRIEELRRRISEADEQIDLLRAEMMRDNDLFTNTNLQLSDTPLQSYTNSNGVIEGEIPMERSIVGVNGSPTSINNNGGVNGITVSGLGPRNERPEDVDTLVRIRQLQHDRSSVADRIELRRRQLASIRQDLADSRRRVELTSDRLNRSNTSNNNNNNEITFYNLPSAALIVQNEESSESTIGTRSASLDNRRDENGMRSNGNDERDEREESIRELLHNAQQAVEARRSLMAAINDSNITLSSPITANMDPIPGVRVSVGTSTHVEDVIPSSQVQSANNGLDHRRRSESVDVEQMIVDAMTYTSEGNGDEEGAEDSLGSDGATENGDSGGSTILEATGERVLRSSARGDRIGVLQDKRKNSLLDPASVEAVNGADIEPLSNQTPHKRRERKYISLLDL